MPWGQRPWNHCWSNDMLHFYFARLPRVRETERREAWKRKPQFREALFRNMTAATLRVFHPRINACRHRNEFYCSLRNFPKDSVYFGVKFEFRSHEHCHESQMKFWMRTFFLPFRVKTNKLQKMNENPTLIWNNKERGQLSVMRPLIVSHTCQAWLINHR